MFSGRYKALVVDGGGTGYVRTVCDYVHLNPARAKLLGPDQKLKDYDWSSYGEYLKRPGAADTLAAGGPLAGGDGDREGQCGGAERI